MHGILHVMFDNGILVYINDILIYTKTNEEHTRLIKSVLQKLLATVRCANIDECQLHVHEIEFIGF